MTRSTSSLLVLFGVFCICFQPGTVRGAIDGTGDIDPANPDTWDTNTTGYIGKMADGTLTVDDDSDLLSDSVYVGYESGVTGEASVDGAGSTWTNSGYDFNVGHEGSGTLNITNGGAISSEWGGVIGYVAGSTGIVNVNGAGSTWTNSGLLFVGYEGSGALNITGGGVVNNEWIFIGDSSGSTGEVTVDGGGSTLTNSGFCIVGYHGSGTLNITNSGLVTVEGNTSTSYGSESSCTINFVNGTLETGGLLVDPDDLTGTGTINTHGLVSDIDLVFDTTHGLTQTINIV